MCCITLLPKYLMHRTTENSEFGGFFYFNFVHLRWVWLVQVSNFVVF